MRTFPSILRCLCLLPLLASSACLVDVEIGSGELTTRSIELGAFDRIESRGFLDLELLQGDKHEVLVRCDENLHSHLSTFLEGSTLILESRNGISLHSNSGCTARITLPDLSSVATRGSGDVFASKFVSHELELRSSGSGDIRLSVEASKLRVKTSGSGDISLRGKSHHLHLESEGSGNIMARSLEAHEVHANTRGSGDLEITARQSILASTYGSGNIDIWGHPNKRDVHSKGSGSVRFKQDSYKRPWSAHFTCSEP